MIINRFFIKALLLSVLILTAAWGHTLPAAALQAEGAPDLVVYALNTGGAGIQDANVTLWQCAHDGPCENIRPLAGCKTLTVSCGFFNITPGLYNVTVDKGGYTGYSVIDLTPGGGTKNVNVIVDEHQASMRPPPRYIGHGGPLPSPIPLPMPGEPPSAAQLPPASGSWLEPIPETNYYGHDYNITSTYNVTQPDGTYILASDVRYNDSIRGIVTADGYYTIRKGGDGYWRYVNFYTGNDSGRAGIDKPESSDCGGVYEGPPPKHLSLYLPYVPRPGYIDPGIELSGISGMITDRSGRGVSGAKVTVFNSTLNRLTGEYTDLGIVLNPANPQFSRDGRDSIAGIYAIPYLPAGTYRVVAEKDGHTASRIVNIDPKKGTSTADIVIDVTG